jgi:Cu(I)/Ag(I) efflux system membrane fusion protein
LRPGLYGTVLLEEPGTGPVLTVPRSAVLDSGTRQVVLIETGPGRFAPRDVSLGRRGGDRIEILDGLAEGEQVVVSANFLIDAESNLQSALEGLTGHAGHGAPSGTTDDPHAGHGENAADPHAGHAMPATPEDARAAASGAGASDGHEGHDGHDDHGTVSDHDAHAPATGHEGH